MEHHGATGPSVPGRWWGPSVTTVANADVMNQLCRVCGEPAAGFHFGAFTCEGCKSFFGRTYNNLNSVSECKNNGECVINKKNRTSCKACRLRKCLLVGMSKSGSRYGRRSNWFKIHCLLQEQQQQHQQSAVSRHQPQQQSPPSDVLLPPHLSLYSHHPQSPTSSGIAGVGNDIAGNKSWYYKDSSALLLDVDNNNGPPPTASFCPGFLMKPSSASDGFWLSSSPRHNFLSAAVAARPSQPTLPPYFVSPFLQNANYPSNYLLPFLPRPPFSTADVSTLSSPSSSLRSSSSPPGVRPPSVTVAAATTVTGKDDGDNDDDDDDDDDTEAEREAEERDDGDNIVDNDKLLEKLRSLGPVQDRPIDLSTGVKLKGVVERSPNAADNKDETNNRNSACRIVQIQSSVRAATRTASKSSDLLDLTRSSTPSSAASSSC